MFLISEKITCVGMAERCSCSPRGFLSSFLVLSHKVSRLLDWVWKAEALVIKCEAFEGNVKIYYHLKWLLWLLLLLRFLSSAYRPKGKWIFRESSRLLNILTLKIVLLPTWRLQTFFYCSSTQYKSVFCWFSSFPSSPRATCRICHIVYSLPRKNSLQWDIRFWRHTWEDHSLLPVAIMALMVLNAEYGSKTQSSKIEPGKENVWSSPGD